MAARNLYFTKAVHTTGLNDPRVRRCGWSSLGFWSVLQHLLGISERYGYLLLEGTRADAEDLAEYFREPVENVRGFLGELEARKLLRRTQGNVLYSPDMVAAATAWKAGRPRRGDGKIAREDGKIARETESSETLFDPQGPDIAEQSGNSADDPLLESESRTKKDPSLFERGDSPAPAAPATPTPAEPEPDLFGDRPAPKPDDGPPNPASRPRKPSAAALARKLEKAVAAWNAFAARHGKPLVLRLTAPRKAKLIRQLHELGGLDGWMALLGKVEASPWLLGQVLGQDGTPFRIRFDHLLRESAVVKIMEGNYDLHEAPAMRDAPPHDAPGGRPAYRPGSQAAYAAALGQFNAANRAQWGL